MFPVNTLLLILFDFIDIVFCIIRSVVSTKSSTIVISNLSSRNNKFEYVRDYLNRYRYFNGQDGSGLTIVDVNSSEFIFALNKFQAYYKLEITKTINDATLEVMKTPRCGMTDIAASFNLKGTFWRKDPILWHFRGATNKQIKLATVAFQFWEKYANINFQQCFENPNIIISFKYKDHLKKRDSKRCGFTLDNNDVSEIHINQNKDWNEELYDISKDKLSLYITLAHEIGHAIGIDHSPIHQSLMHSVYHEPTSPFNAEDFELSDDQLAVASLYGQRKIKKKSKTTTMTTKRTFQPSHSLPPAKQPKKKKKKDDTPSDLCKIEDQLDAFLVVNRFKYIFYKKYVSIVKLEDNQYNEPKIIFDWLNFLPSNFERIDAIYQRPSGEIVFFINQEIYRMSYPGLKLLDGFPRKQDTIGVTSKLKINAALNSYTGRTYIFYEQNFFVELDECSFSSRRHGYIYNKFDAFPSSIYGVLRYTNGYWYIINKERFYQYDEFNNKMISTGKNKLQVVNIICPNESILQQLWKLITRLVLIE
ncbi:hypothetical protein FQA39_LY09181 [Lamprigera yunnana]|nr:hypothetical protein FQA39_LY09181 [Lamprigera yunnana]